MESLTQEVLSVLTFLLPGFLATWVFRSLTSFPKPSQFDQVVQALIFTTVIRAVSLLLQSSCEWLGESAFALGIWGESSELAVPLVLAVGLGITLAWLTNHDHFHSLLRAGGITRETSFPSEWFSSFARRQTYVVLHLVGERRLYGWPVEWPGDPERGHFRIAEAEWLLDVGEEASNQRVPLTGVEYVVVPVKDVEMVEFMAPDAAVMEVPHVEGTATAPRET